MLGSESVHELILGTDHGRGRLGLNGDATLQYLGEDRASIFWLLYRLNYLSVEGEIGYRVELRDRRNVNGIVC